MNPAAKPVPLQAEKIQVIDLVRSVSILVVLAGHLQVFFVNQHSSIYFLEYAWFKLWANHGYGVHVFFVVSGYLITRLIATAPQGLYKPDYRNFYVRRIGRIVPLLLMSCLIGIGIGRLGDPDLPQLKYCFKGNALSFGIPFWLSIVTFSFNWLKIALGDAAANFGLHWDVLWSLSIEEQFYFFYPFLLKKTGNDRRLARVFFFFILLGPLSLIVRNVFFPHNEQIFYNSFAAFNLMAMGGLLYIVSRKYRDYFLGRPGLCRGLCLGGFSLFLFAYLHIIVRVEYWWPVFGSSMVGVGVFLFLLGGLHLKSFESKFWAPFGFPGRLSYGIYLLHPLVLYLFWPFWGGKNQFVAWSLFCGASTLLAWFSYRTFEMPANFFLRRLLGRRS